jgi:hypothetical protein
MNFSYRGFEQHNGKRAFTFLGLESKQPDRVFHLSVDLALLVQHSVSLQETPGLCVEVLTRAASEGEGQLRACEDYALSGPDLLAFTAPRRALALTRGAKKPARFQRPKPSQASQPFAPSPEAVARWGR